MKILITLLKPLSFLPALLMMYIIFSFSAQPGEVSGNLSYKISYEIIETKSELLSENLSSEEIAYKADGIHYYVRKAAHMTEYFLLAIAISFPLYVYGVRGIWLMLLAGIVCVGFAGLDEYHQSFVDARTPAVKDVGIPVMFGASLLKILKFGFSFTGTEVMILIVGMVVAFVVSIIAIKFLMGYIKKHDFKAFGWYRIALGILVLGYFIGKTLLGCK